MKTETSLLFILPLILATTQDNMSVWLNTIGNNVLSIAICDRCHMKRPYTDMRPDGNIPALRVCSDACSDQFDPYRLPARQPEKISIRFPRPDEDIAESHDAITTDPNIVNTPNDVTQGTEGEWGIAPETSQNPLDGNLDNLSP
jgi:hypothetical protein